ncbi:uncharacterized protein PSANT_00812 [Moesziomyces antarcticus]|uniref:Uncharacterized protein n=2 Tax=Pseudozyma antarctica TaxID=84753 RepID=A0A5C3FFM5_PSEA2|nr:uncharacterized protein PSANT_00812 [Moesziomyces antarcticus]
MPEPFLETSFPGWTFDNIYNVPHWDGGDKATCPAPAKSLPATRSKTIQKGSKQEFVQFCQHGNTPARIPDQSVCITKPPKLAPGGRHVKRQEDDSDYEARIIAASLATAAEDDAANDDAALSKRTPLAAAPMMGMMGGGGGGGMSTFMPLINTGIDAGSKLGVAFLQYLTQREKDQAEAKKADPLAGANNSTASATEADPLAASADSSGGSASLLSPATSSAGGASGSSPGASGSDTGASGGAVSSDITGTAASDTTSPQPDADLPSKVGGTASAKGNSGDTGSEDTGPSEAGDSGNPLAKSSSAGDVVGSSAAKSTPGGLKSVGSAIGSSTSDDADDLSGTSIKASLPQAGSSAGSSKVGGSTLGSSAIDGSADVGSALGGSAVGSSKAGTTGHAASDSLTIKSKRDATPHPVTHSDSAAPGSSSKCGGSAVQCKKLIERSIPYCVPHKPAPDAPPHTHDDDDPDAVLSSQMVGTMIRVMARHCLRKCPGFAGLANSDHDFKSKTEKCAHDTKLFNKSTAHSSKPARKHAATPEHAPISKPSKLEHASEPKQASTQTPASDTAKDEASPMFKRAVTPSRQPEQCRGGYEAVFRNALQPVSAYNGQLFGSVVSDPGSFLHWGLVRSVAQCQRACDETQSCVFINVYQQTFSLDHPNIRLVNRDVDDEVQLRKQFAGQAEAKKNSFVEGHLTCALYSRCFRACQATHRSGENPVFFEKSMGFCKSDKCSSATQFSH